MEKPSQPSFFNEKGQVSSEVIFLNRQSDLDNTFQTDEQKARALDLIKSGKATDAATARSLMQKEDLEDDKDSYRLKK